MAMDVLPIQASSVPCERVFSSSKETITPRRNRISAELMESLQLLKFSVKNGRGISSMAGPSKAEEEDELEALGAMESLFPEDPHSFRATFVDGRSK